MNNQDTAFAPILNGIVSVLDLVEKLHGRQSAEKLLEHVTEAFKATGTTSITAEGKGTERGYLTAETTTPDQLDVMFNAFIHGGGYSLKDHNILMGYSGQLVKPLAFGIMAATPNEPDLQLKFLLVNGDMPVFNIRQLAKHSYNRKPAYGNTAPFMFYPGTGDSITPYEFKQLVESLQVLGATELTQAVQRMSPWERSGVVDDVPKDTLVPLTDEERKSLQAIPDLQFAYMGADEPVLRITPVGTGFVFHTPNQSVEVAARNVDTSYIHAPAPRNGYWLLQVTPNVAQGGVSLEAVLTLPEDSSNRDYYQSLIDIFTDQALRHAPHQQ